MLALLARGRAAGIGVLLSTQELADLARVAEGFEDQVIGTTAVKIAHRQDVPESAETIAGIAGTRQVWEHTRQTRHGLLGPTDTGLGSKRLNDEYVVHPNTIKHLPTGGAVLIRKNPRPDARVIRVITAHVRKAPRRWSKR